MRGPSLVRVWLDDWTTRFAAVFFLTVSTRTVLVSVLPIITLEMLGNAVKVSLLYFVVSLGSILCSLFLPALILRIRTRATFHLGAVVVVVCAGCLLSDSLPLFVFGMVLFGVSNVIFEVTMNLYILHRIPRREVGLFEPKRVLFMVAAYTVGPTVGVYLYTRVDSWTPFALSAFIALLSVVYFRRLGLTEAGARQRLGQTANPVRNVPKFFRQPRLRLAWFISFSRSAWWVTFFIYAPIYAVTSGLGEMAGGYIVSLGVTTVFTVTFWGRVARRKGVRHLLLRGFALGGIASLVFALIPADGWAGVFILLCAAMCTASLDGAGNVAFLRAVRPSQQAQMAGVFGTYRDMSQLAVPAVAAIVLRALPVPAVFGVAGAGMLMMAWFSRYLPRRLA